MWQQAMQVNTCVQPKNKTTYKVNTNCGDVALCVGVILNLLHCQSCTFCMEALHAKQVDLPQTAEAGKTFLLLSLQ